MTPQAHATAASTVKKLHNDLGTALSAPSVNWQQVLAIMVQILTALGPVLSKPDPVMEPNLRKGPLPPVTSE